jgi:glycosyltransferase involved in cell wall biosynthesis
VVPLTIAHLFTHSEITRGGAVQGLLLARALQERGHRVVSWLHAPFGRRPCPEDVSQQSVTLAGMDIRWINMKDPVSYGRFRRWLGRQHVDILHTHRSLALLFAYFTAFGLDGTALVANRGAVTQLRNPLVRHVLRSRRLDHMVVVAQAVKDHLVRDLSMGPDKISVVYGSFDEQKFTVGVQGDHIRRELGLADAIARLVVCVAAVEPRKGLEYLMEAARVVLRDLPEVTFVVVGSIADHTYYQQIQNMARDSGVLRHFRFLGHRSDVAEILAAADVSVSASVEEGLAGALRESLAMEKPVVCTNVGGNAELIRHGESGWVVPPRDAQALASAVQEALQQPLEARRRAQVGRQVMLECCSNRVRCDRIEAIYRTLYRRRHPSAECRDDCLKSPSRT